MTTASADRHGLGHCLIELVVFAGFGCRQQGLIQTRVISGKTSVGLGGGPKPLLPRKSFDGRGACGAEHSSRMQRQIPPQPGKTFDVVVERRRLDAEPLCHRAQRGGSQTSAMAAAA